MDNIELIQIKDGYLEFQYYYNNVFISKNIKLSELTYIEIYNILNKCNQYHDFHNKFYENVHTQVSNLLLNRRIDKIKHLKELICLQSENS